MHTSSGILRAVAMILRLSKKEYYALCKQVFVRDEYKCRSCGFRAGLHCHHVVFRSQQGEDTTGNLLVLCSQCHEAVHRSDLHIVYVETARESDGMVQFIRRNGWRPQ